MATSASSPAAWLLVPFFTKRHQDALNVEIQVLGMILQKNRSSHKRTRYYRRAQSAWRYYHRYLSSSTVSMIDFEPWIQNTIPQLERDIQREQEQIQRQQKRKDILWELVKNPSSNVKKTTSETTTQDDGISTTVSRDTIHAKNDTTIDARISTWLTQCQDDWRTVMLHRIPTCMQKIEAAGKICFDEMARGFFLPFHSVLVGCLSRIHILLFRYRFYIATELSRQLALICDKRENAASEKPAKQKIDTYASLYARMSPPEKQILTTLQQDLETIVQSLNNTSQKLQTKSSSSSSTSRTTIVLQSLGLLEKKQFRSVDGEAEDETEISTMEDIVPSVLAPKSPMPKEPEATVACDSPLEQQQQQQQQTDAVSTPFVHRNADVGESIGRIDDAAVVGSLWNNEPLFSTSSLSATMKTDAHDIASQKLSSTKQKPSAKHKRKQLSDPQESTITKKKNTKKKRKASDFFDQLFG